MTADCPEAIFPPDEAAIWRPYQCVSPQRPAYPQCDNVVWRAATYANVEDMGGSKTALRSRAVAYLGSTPAPFCVPHQILLSHVPIQSM